MTRTALALPLAVSLALGTLLGGTPAAARELAGVNLPDTITVDGKALVLNGAGIRKKFIIKVYVGGLYLEAPAATYKDIAAADRAWTVRMAFLRTVEKDKVLGAFKEGFENNSSDKAAALQPALDKISAAITDLQKGSVLVISYSPGKGTTTGIEGGKSVTIDGKDLADALLRNWLGSKPADADLKAGMLGGK